MYTVVHTWCLDGEANATGVKVQSGLSKEDAVTEFTDVVKALVDEILGNEFLHGKCYINKNKALIKIEGVHHVVAIIEENRK